MRQIPVVPAFGVGLCKMSALSVRCRLVLIGVSAWPSVLSMLRCHVCTWVVIVIVSGGVFGSLPDHDKCEDDGCQAKDNVDSFVAR